MISLTSSLTSSTWRNALLFLAIVGLSTLIDGKEIDSKTDLQQEESLSAEHRSFDRAHHHKKYQQQTTGSDDSVSSSGAWPLSKPEISQIKALNVKCEKNHMRVHIEFDRPFYGMIFSKGHFNDAKCVHLPAGSGHLTTNFDIFLGACGMTSSGQNQGQLISQQGQTSGLYIENTVVIQYDPQVQEIWDQARKLRCTWYDYYEKSVSFRPFNVDMLDAVTANFLGDNIQCWMQIQVGKGPWASEVSGIVKIGQTMTMVLAIKDEENKFDMLVRNCIAHDGKHQPIQLVDEFGCVIRPKIMSKFQKVKNFGNSATVVSYAYFQAFKFPDTMNVHFQCVIQVCRYECPEPVCESPSLSGNMSNSHDITSRMDNLQQHLLTAGSQLQADYAPAPSNKDTIAMTTMSGTLANNNVIIGKGLTHGTSVFPNNLLLSRSGHLLPSQNASTNAKARSNDIDVASISVTTTTDSSTQSIANKQSTRSQSSHQALANLLARPRSLSLESQTSTQSGRYVQTANLTDRLSRGRRSSSFKDIPTRKTIQVVAPGDVSFATDSSSNEFGNVAGESGSNVPEAASSSSSFDTRSMHVGSSVCMSTVSFAGALLLFVCLLTVCALIATFLYLRMKQLTMSLRKQYATGAYH